MSKFGAKLPTGRLVHWTDLAAMAEWERLHVDLAKANLANDEREVGDPGREIARQIIDLEEQMDASGVAFELSGIPGKRWIEIKAEATTEPLDDDGGLSEADYLRFVNAVMREPGVILSVSHVANGEPIPFDGPKDWDAEAETMTFAQLWRFGEKVKELNQSRVGAPKSQLASLAMRVSDKS